MLPKVTKSRLWHCISMLTCIIRGCTTGGFNTLPSLASQQMYGYHEVNSLVVIAAMVSSDHHKWIKSRKTWHAVLYCLVSTEEKLGVLYVFHFACFLNLHQLTTIDKHFYILWNKMACNLLVTGARHNFFSKRFLRITTFTWCFCLEPWNLVCEYICALILVKWR